jgi:tRNA(Arg) A34 adenosine deaminase TadA
LKWSDLSEPWKSCFEGTWEAYCVGSVPIGSVVVDGDGKIIARGRNHIEDENFVQNRVNAHKLAHAELNALLSIRGNEVDPRVCAIYTFVEPCPQCLGAIYISGVRKIYYAARDPYAGSLDLLGTTPYLSRKLISVNEPEAGVLENLSMGIYVIYFLQVHPQVAARVLPVWQQVLKEGVQFGENLSENDTFKSMKNRNVPETEVLEWLLNQLTRMKA